MAADGFTTTHTPEPERERLRSMLSRPLPEIPPVYFYDDHGSALFEEITGQPEYYQTRAELGILERCAAEILAESRPHRLVELGSGAGRKIRLLLDAWRPEGRGASCTMLDVNELFLETSVYRLRADYPGLLFKGIVGDFTTDLVRLGPGGERLTVFFGGTIGNLYPEERRAFLDELARRMEPTDALLVGVDLVKEPGRLEAAYNDAQGVTAAFNRRALHSLNRRFGADFEPEAFRHRAFYAAERAWIEMRLVATRAMTVRVPALDVRLELEEGAEIRTEVSCKFTRASLEEAARGLTVAAWFTDPDRLFALAVLRRRPAR